MNRVSVRLSSDKAASVTAKSFWMSAHVHTCLAHVCVSGLFAIVLSLAFSHPPPHPIITSLCPLFLFCFLSRFFFLPPSFPFCSTSAHPLYLPSRSSLLQNGAVLRCSWSCGVYRRERERRPVTCATSSSSCTVSE